MFVSCYVYGFFQGFRDVFSVVCFAKSNRFDVAVCAE